MVALMAHNGAEWLVVDVQPSIATLILKSQLIEKRQFPFYFQIGLFDQLEEIINGP